MSDDDLRNCPPSTRQATVPENLRVDHDLVAAVRSYDPPLSRATIATGVIMSEAGRRYPVADWRTKLDAIERAVRAAFDEKKTRRLK